MPVIHQMDCNVPLEQLLEDFAERSRIEDIEQFTGIFSYAKRSGGDFYCNYGKYSSADGRPDGTAGNHRDSIDSKKDGTEGNECNSPIYTGHLSM